MLGRSSTLASHCKHATNLIDWLVNKNMIDVVDIHVSVSISMSSLVDMVCRYMIASMTRSEDADCKNMSGFFGLFARISFQKGNSFDH